MNLAFSNMAGLALCIGLLRSFGPNLLNMNASRQSFIVSALLCALMAVLFVARWRLAPYPVEIPFEGGMPLAAMLTRFTVAHPWWAATIAAVIVVWTLLLLVQLSIRYATAASRNYLPAQIFLVGAGGLAVPGEALAAFIATWLATLAIRQFAFSFHKGLRFSEVFHAGFYLGLMPLLYAPVVVAVVPVAIAALLVYRRLGREAVVCFAGLVLPVPAAGFIHWAAGADGGFIWRELWRCALENRPTVGLVPNSVVLPAALILILVLVAILWVAGHKKSVRKTQYKFMAHISLTLLFFAASAAVPGTSITLAAIAAVPCAVSLPYAFAEKTATASTLLYCLILAAVLVLNLLPVLRISLP